MKTTTSTGVSSAPVSLKVLTEPIEQLCVHLIGIGGAGMSGLAGMLLKRGSRISGSDRAASIELVRLAERGALVTTRQEADSIPADTNLVVASAAIPADHPELLAARERGLPVIKYAQLLGHLMRCYDGIAVSGTHGKSTTAAWLSYVLKQAGLDPSFVIGARVPQLDGGSGVGDGPHFVAEACEYDRSFHHLAPRRAAILNIEEDHLDCYADLAAIRRSFAEFAGLIGVGGLLVYNHDDSGCREIAAQVGCRTCSFGSAAEADWRVVDVAVEEGLCVGDFEFRGERLGRLRLGLPGRHNLENALAVAALAHDCGVPWGAIASGLSGFGGAERRLQLRGEIGGVRVLDDYAHHPTEIRVTLDAARRRYQPGCLWCVFQPHQHSRTRFLLDDFARSFAQADRVVVPDIYLCVTRSGIGKVCARSTW